MIIDLALASIHGNARKTWRLNVYVTGQKLYPMPFRGLFAKVIEVVVSCHFPRVVLLNVSE